MPLIVHQNDFAVTELDHLLDRPIRAEGALQLGTVASFVDYVNRHSVESESIVKFNRSRFVISAVLDYHSNSNDPGWCKHSASVILAYSRQMRAWSAILKAALSQTSFAEFIEERIIDIIEPTGAEMLAIASNLEATKTEKFRAVQNLANGDRVCHFQSETQEQGSTKVPTRFKIAVPLFEDSPTRTPLEVTLRVRIAEGHLSFTLAIPALQDVIDVVWAEVVKGVRADLNPPVDCFDVA